MNVKNLYQEACNKLAELTNENEREAEIIIQNIFSLNKLDIILGKEISDISKIEKFYQTLEKRKERVPLQYIFKKQRFREDDFYVDERVLIPRPETELLVDKVIELANLIDKQALNILDVGTGSGAIAISLAKELKKAFVTSIDISEDALAVANINKKNILKTQENLKIIKSDKFECFENTEIKFDFIVSNPPYIPLEKYKNLEPEVLNYEPKLALVGDGEDGISFYKYFYENVPKYLFPNSYLCCEIGYDQKEILLKLFSSNDNINYLDIINDYSNNPRILIAKFK